MFPFITYFHIQQHARFQSFDGDDGDDNRLRDKGYNFTNIFLHIFAMCRFKTLLEDVFLKMDPHGHEKITISQFEHIFADEDTTCILAPKNKARTSRMSKAAEMQCKVA